LADAIEQNASDVFISVYAPPLIKANGIMRPIDGNAEPLDVGQNQNLIYSILNDRESAEFEEKYELNKSLHVPSVGRFRVNVFRQRGEPALVARHIKDRIPSIKSLGLPEALKDLIMEERGLLLVVGGTGTGKSTTLAAMIDYRNASRPGHILTIEDPIEFIYENRKSLVNQREVGMDTRSFDDALINAMREAPDVILIGEIRDEKTMKQAIAYAETGHLCLATLHANNANQAIDRIINFFPEDSHKQVLQDLSLNLKAIISQRLCKGFDNKRVAVLELMVKTPYISELIDKGRIDEIKSAMEKSKGRVCVTFDSALYDLVAEGKISQEEALRQADSRNNLSLRFRLEAPGDNPNYNIKSEYTFDKKAPFDHYETFRVTPLKVQDARRDVEPLLTAAIQYGLEKKGMQMVETDPDIDVQFVFGIKKAKALGLEQMPDEGIYKNYEPETEEHAMLVINIVDTRTHRAVYRLTASRRLDDLVIPDKDLNHEMQSLLSTFPANP
jgi:twitching motility protein PilU